MPSSSLWKKLHFLTAYHPQPEFTVRRIGQNRRRSIPLQCRNEEFSIGKDVREVLENDLALERESLSELKRTVAFCLEQADTSSREIMEHIFVDAAEHIQWLESQTSLLRQVGYKNYCAHHIEVA